MESFNYILILLLCSVVFLVVCRRLYLPPVIGYLSVGILVGPGGVGWIPSIESMNFLAEFGIVFLMFTLGLEFSIAQLMTSKKAMIGIGGLQVLLCSMAISGLAYFFNIPFKQAFIIGSSLSLSSTAVVLKQLHEQKEQQTNHGKLSIKILLFQDIAAILLLIIIPALGSKEEFLFDVFLTTILKGTMVFILMVIIGSRVVKPLFHEVAKAHSTELFMIATLLVALSAAATTYYFELSMPLGAFLAGLMLGETEFRQQIEIDIRPFREVLLGLFFIIVGSFLDLQTLPAVWAPVLSILGILLFLKTIIIILVIKIFSRFSIETAFKTGIILAQGGEFGFVALTEAIDYKIINPDQKPIIFAAVVISIMLAPLLIRYNNKIVKFFIKIKNDDSIINYNPINALTNHSDTIQDHVIICGFGRVGQILAKFLGQEKIHWLALDLDPTLLHKSSIAGEQVFYGDASNPEVLLAAGVYKAKMVVLSFADEAVNLEIVKYLRSLKLKFQIFVRTKDETTIQAFEAAGATEIVPEILEGSIMLASHLLFALGVPTTKIINKVIKTHSSRYEMLRHLYKGNEEPNILEEEDSARRSLQTIVIPENAVAINQPIEKFFPESVNTTEISTETVTRYDFSLKYLTRDGNRYEALLPSTIILEQDVLVIFATSEEKVILEEKLLRG